MEAERGSLPFALLHGEPLVACAAWALGQADVFLVDASVEWEVLRTAGEPIVFHDALCPMTPADFIVHCLQHSEEHDAVVIGTRPVTDTIKEVEGSVVGHTVDRDSLVAISSPLVVPPGILETLPQPLPADLAEAVSQLADAGHHVIALTAPAEARRVASTDDVHLLEALTAPY